MAPSHKDLLQGGWGGASPKYVWYQCSLYLGEGAINKRERTMEEISDKTRNGEEISYKTRNRISPETVPRELAQHLQEESVSFLAEDGEKSFELEIHTMIKRSNEYATWKKYAEEKDLKIYLPETKAKERGDVLVVIFWSFYPKRTDDRQPCQEEVERVIYLFLTQCNTFLHEESR